MHIWSVRLLLIALKFITGEKEIRIQADLIEDETAPGGYLRQEISPFSQYGITCGLVSITDIKG